MDKVRRLLAAITERKLVVLPLAALAVGAGVYVLNAEATTFVAVPDNTVAAGSWVASTGTHEAAIDDGPTSSPSDYVEAPSGTTVSTLNLDTSSPTNVASATSLRLYINSYVLRYSGNPTPINTIIGKIFIGSNEVSTVEITPSTSGYTWQSATAVSGNWSQSELDSMRIELTRTERSGGNPSSRTDTVRIASVYVDVTYTEEMQLEQSDYRWFSNADSTTPGAPLASQNTVANASSDGQTRLQMLMVPTTGSLDSVSNNYKLQYSPKSVACDASFSGEIYSDINPITVATPLLSGSAAINVDTTSNPSWISPTNVLADDDASATTTVPNNTETDALDITGYSFAGVEGAIRSVSIVVDSSSSGGFGFYHGSLLKSGVPVTSEQLTSSKFYSPPITATDLTEGNLGVRIYKSATGLGGDQTINTDHVGIIVEYEVVDPDTLVSYYDNQTPTDSDNAVNGGLTHANPIILQSYQEKNPFTIKTGATVSTGEAGLWDFSLDTSQLDPGSYCFRVVDKSGNELNSYATIPELTVPPPSYTQSSYRWYENADSTTPGSPLAAQNTATTIASNSNLRLRQLIRVDDGDADTAKQYRLQYGEKVTSCSAASFSTINVSANSYSNVGQSIYDVGNVQGMEWIYIAPEVVASFNQSFFNDPASTLEIQDYNLAVPPGSVIEGIKFELDYNSTSVDNFSITQLRLQKNGIAVGDSKSATSIGSGSGTITLGSETDLWGTSWTASDVNASSFGTELLTEFTTQAGGEMMIIETRITVYIADDPPLFGFFDNPTTADDVSISSAAEDPDDGSRTIVPQTYIEADPFQASSSFAAGESAMWDLSLKANDAPAGTYCFRTVNDDDSPLDTYLSYPEVTVGDLEPPLENRMRGGQSVIDGIKSPLGW